MMADTILSPAHSVDADHHDHHHRHIGDVRDGGDDAALLLQPAAEGMTVKVDEWDGGPVAKATAPMMIRRPRRIVGHIPWQWRWIVAGIRLTRTVRKSAKQQMKQFNKLQRQMIRRVLPRHKAMRGARAR